MNRICLVGAGFISRAHVDALRTVPEVRIAAIADPNPDAAARLARQSGNPTVFRCVEEAIAADAFDTAHVLVPPDHHAAAALPILEAGKPVLLEKPLATSSAECRRLLDASEACAAPIGVNQNFVFHPAFLRLRRVIERGELGQPNFVSCIYNVPLRQLAARQFGHWMFHQPLNILLEQAIHPLSQIAILAGAIESAEGIAGTPAEIAPGVRFFDSAAVTLGCARLPAQLRFAVGQAFPSWKITVVCDDGVGTADILANRMYAERRTKWLEAIDSAVSGARTGGAVIRDGLSGAAGYALSTLKLTGSRSPFHLSMKASLTDFYRALADRRSPTIGGDFGGMLVRACETIADRTFAGAAASCPAVRPRAARTGTSPARVDVAVLGGTGFIGSYTVRAFLDAGMRVSVMARSVRNVASVFNDDRVALHRGDIMDGAAVARAIGEAPVVVNLAHGGGSGSWEAIRAAMVGGVETVVRACLDASVQRLVHVGSIASLYLGSPGETITGTTPPDHEAEKRADYARAKAMCDVLLLQMHKTEGLPVCILRPGLVVGAGTSPFHSGLGFYNNEQHCLGWNGGSNPLPFVLVEDVAKAIVAASRTEGLDGRCYNLVGDVRLSAREYIAELARATGRPLRFHPQNPAVLWGQELAKWGVKRATGRGDSRPSRRDILSRGMTASFACDDAKRDLGWQPQSDRQAFVDRAVRVHAATP